MKFAPYMYTLLKTIIPEKKIKMLHRFKMAANNRFLYRVASILAKICKKNTFPREFFNEIWLKVGEHK